MAFCKEPTVCSASAKRAFSTAKVYCGKATADKIPILIF